MQGLHCPVCGATRWHLLPIALDRSRACVVCGSAMQTERRRPGRGPRALAVERRESQAPPTALV
jgi:predicted nucleic acid-binding Zn ribbon protein